MSGPNDSNDEAEILQDQQASNSASPFMSFTPKANNELNRKFTQKKQMPTMAEFMTEFEQERRPSPPIVHIDTSPVTIKRPASILSLESITSYDDDDNQIFSDTARLTLNASNMNGFHSNEDQFYESTINNTRVSFQQTRPISRLYEPAPIDPIQDKRDRERKKLLEFNTKIYVKKLLKSVRSVSRRVVDIHNKDNRIRAFDKDQKKLKVQQPQQDNQRQQQQQEDDADDYSDTANSIIEEEIIPMTRTSSNNHLLSPEPTTPNTPLPNYTTAQPSIKPVIEKLPIQLYGKSLKLFTPSNPFRLFLANILYWK